MFQWVFTFYTSSPGASIRVFQRPILVYLDVRGVEIPLLSTVSISNCRYQEAPGEVVWSDFLAQLPRRSIEILWHLTRPSGLVKCQRISILLLGNCARISQTCCHSPHIFCSSLPPQFQLQSSKHPGPSHSPTIHRIPGKIIFQWQFIELEGEQHHSRRLHNLWNESEYMSHIIGREL